MKASACIRSMRLRTLPLSLAGVCTGIFIAAKGHGTNAATIVFLILTTCLLQILSNLSNELGDTLHGTDTDERQGIHYSIQDGLMTVAQMKRLIAVVAVLCCICGTLMILFSFGTLLGWEPLMFLALGASAVVAAMRYTLGPNPYGYRGLGDLFVFIFFGLVSTLGAYYICSHDLNLLPAVLPAGAIGSFSIGVLNVNNIRDMKTDEGTRTTVALKLGARRAKMYQIGLISTGWILMCVWTALNFVDEPKWQLWLHFITLPLYILHIKGVLTREGKALDPMLPLLVASTFLMSVLASGTYCLL